MPLVAHAFCQNVEHHNDRFCGRMVVDTIEHFFNSSISLLAASTSFVSMTLRVTGLFSRLKKMPVEGSQTAVLCGACIPFYHATPALPRDRSGQQ